MAVTLTFPFHHWLRALAERLRPGVQRSYTAGPVSLERGATWSVRTQADESLTLTCGEGLLWLTREGDSRDYVLNPGQTVRLEVPGRVVVQALRPASFRLASGPSRARVANELRAS
ncbi:DUF2917 domain-containing protein [Pyxidicoccus xibeiensis]|uniref:DUF2917 domain-containing protein n=1 Tax=Pyxidicoccus xibeiensis TaxID=2906759 RepID=UPI0020A6FF71|nr:DUF2917 domain-containing protein [Pyxidicoccus xibeiensis]MCP3140079.1 DUF2917 domain-containing protein [Pyxidicoccus xibeiensis]